MDTKISYISSVQENTSIVPLIEDDKNTYLSQLIYPITIQGEKEGIIILAEINNQNSFGQEHMFAIKLIAEFLSKQME